MKAKLFFLTLLLIAKSCLFAQDSFVVRKIDNNNFPNIKVYISAKEELEFDKFNFIENNIQLEYSCDTIEGKTLGNGSLSILFVINKSAKTEIKNALINTIKKLSKNDKINLAIITGKDPTKTFLHYISPNFSNNHEYFVTFIKNIPTKDNDCTYRAIDFSNFTENIILQSQDIYSNKGTIVFLDSISNIKPFKNVLKQKNIPFYMLLAQQKDTVFQNKTSMMCSKSGGIYTVSEPSKFKKYLNSYVEDISLNKNSQNKMLRFSFETKQHKKKNFFKIIYKNKTKEYSFNRLQKHLLSFREQMLLLLSAMLFFVLLIVIYRQKQIVKKIHLKFLKDFKPIEAIPVKNIEIIVKTKGFNKTYFFEKHLIKIGRSGDNDIVIPDRTVSISHALINREGNNFMLQDMGSTNGVFINQKKIKRQLLKTNDKIKLGAAILIVRI